MSVKEIRTGVIITIFVKPNAANFSIKVDGSDIVVQATEEPNKGKANKEILKEFSKIFHAKVELLSGATSRQKQICILGITKKDAEELLVKL